MKKYFLIPLVVFSVIFAYAASARDDGEYIKELRARIVSLRAQIASFAVLGSGGGRVPTNPIDSTVPNGTEGSVLFVGATSLLKQDNANFFWDDVNNRLGIASTSPAGLLSVEMGTDPFPFWVGDKGTTTPTMAITGAGNIAIGTTSPGSLLSIQAGNLQVTGTSTSHAFVATSTLQVGTDSKTSTTTVLVNTRGATNGVGGCIAMKNAADGVMYRIYIDANASPQLRVEAGECR